MKAIIRVAVDHKKAIAGAILAACGFDNVSQSVGGGVEGTAQSIADRQSFIEQVKKELGDTEVIIQED